MRECDSKNLQDLLNEKLYLSTAEKNLNFDVYENLIKTVNIVLRDGKCVVCKTQVERLASHYWCYHTD